MATDAHPIRTIDRFTHNGTQARARAVSWQLLMLTCAAVAVSLSFGAAAWAAPANDAFDAATTISALPFSESVDTTGAGTESLEPQFCNFATRTVWYAITPTENGVLGANTGGTAFPAQISAYRQDSSGLGGLSFLACQNFGGANAVFAVQAGKTYYLQASVLYDFPGALNVQVEKLEPPSNDDFADAQAIGALPYSANLDLTAAGREDGEPASCGASAPGTAWYTFTPTQSGSYTVGTSGFNPVSVHTGGTLSSLTEVVCANATTIFHADAGTTYHLQVASGWGGQVRLTVDVAPPAQASFYYYPSDPSVFDAVQFNDYSWDVAGIVARVWNLGDGFTSTGCCPSHRYASDGSYAAQLEIRTTDGRTATATQTVSVRTHDVGITQILVPKTGRVGLSKQISVNINNSRYPETVRVSILRSVPGGGFEEVGQVTQGVPARSARRSTSFSISYTFSRQDASLGKVTFQAVATILTARDSNSSDNTVIAVPTAVSG